MACQRALVGVTVGDRCSCPAIVWVVELVAVGPIFFAMFYETGADRAFFDIKSFVVERFVGTKQPNRTTGLPFPRSV